MNNGINESFLIHKKIPSDRNQRASSLALQEGNLLTPHVERFIHAYHLYDWLNGTRPYCYSMGLMVKKSVVFLNAGDI